jgi:hypothetical protein
MNYWHCIVLGVVAFAGSLTSSRAEHGVAGNTRAESLCGSATLAKAVIKYYEAEKIHDWETTYKYRGTTFGKIVLFADYKWLMNAESKGWEFKRYDVLGCTKSSANINLVRIRFHERLNRHAAKNIFPKDVLDRDPSAWGTGGDFRPDGPNHWTLNTESITKWAKINGSWFAIEPHGRSHLSLNMEIR